MAGSTMRTASSKNEAKSRHVSDSLVQPFLQTDFDSAEYLNTTLPTLASSSSTTRNGRAVPLPELSSQLQTLLNQLNAQTSRLSTTLTQLTDEIVRSGSRLAYEVEVLRGEALGLTDVFESELKTDIDLLVPAQVPHSAADDQKSKDHLDKTSPSNATNPPFLSQLQDLTGVRENLDSVIKTFGAAMQWPLAPSELSLTSSLISVSAPDSSDDSRSREEKGREHAERLRREVTDLLSTGADGLQAANARVAELRSLAEVWKGTAEEKARTKFVESLQKIVDEKQKALDQAASGQARKPGISPARGTDYRYGNMDAPKLTNEGGSGYGFLQNLRNLKNDMYVE